MNLTALEIASHWGLEILSPLTQSRCQQVRSLLRCKCLLLVFSESSSLQLFLGISMSLLSSTFLYVSSKSFLASLRWQIVSFTFVIQYITYKGNLWILFNSVSVREKMSLKTFINKDTLPLAGMKASVSQLFGSSVSCVLFSCS